MIRQLYYNTVVKPHKSNAILCSSMPLSTLIPLNIYVQFIINLKCAKLLTF